MTAEAIIRDQALLQTPAPAGPKNHFISDFSSARRIEQIPGARAVQPAEREKQEITMHGISPRIYQQTIFDTCARHNTLTVLPTGMGKTVIALMLTALRLQGYPNSKVLFLAPTKPLADQHRSTFEKHLTIDPCELAVFTGHVRPNRRKEMWKTSRIIFSTPQGLENDIISKRIDLADVSLLIFDEAHRAVGEYAYVFLAKQYTKLAKYPRILALTASPGSDMDKILEVCTNLSIEDVEVRTDMDPDVAPYIQDVRIEWKYIALPDEFKRVQKLIADCSAKKIRELIDIGFVHIRNPKRVSRVELLAIQKRLHAEISNGIKDFEVLKSISLTSEAMKVQHALELCETQGIASLVPYLARIDEQARMSTTKAVKNLVADPLFAEASCLIRSLAKAGIEHPKIDTLCHIIVERAIGSGKKTIIFSQYRDTASCIVEELSKIHGCEARLFVGQAKREKTGMSQKQQRVMLDEFREGKFNVLVATSVAEEGLDIPKVDLVVFYEPIPSAIRHIQRRGRTGRLDKGNVIVLVAKDTRDEAYRWSAQHKQRQMIITLRKIKETFHALHPGKSVQPPAHFNSFAQVDTAIQVCRQPPNEITIFVDDRERTARIIRSLSDEGFTIGLTRLAAGDYMLSDRVGVEYKTMQDFVDSLLDGRLLLQLRALRLNYQRPLLIIEGEEDIFGQRAIHPNSIRGMLSTITISYGIPIIWTRTQAETAAQLAAIAKREHDVRQKPFHPHGAKKQATMAQAQEYIISSIPGIGAQLAKPLLERFGSVKNIANAAVDELADVPRVGKEKARQIQRTLTQPYGEKEKDDTA